MIRIWFTLLCLSLPVSSSAEDEAPVSRKGYIVFHSEITDYDKLRVYGGEVAALVPKFGGAFIAMDGDPEPIEGNPDTRRTVILEFPSMEQLWAFWNSAEYAEVKKLREGAGNINAAVVEGVPLEPVQRERKTD